MAVASPGKGLSLAVALGLVAGVAFGVACYALGVGGSGPESGMWLILMPTVGIGEGFLAGVGAWVCARMRPTPLRLAASTAATVAACFVAGKALLEGFSLLGVESVLAAALGLATAAAWPRWVEPPRRRVSGTISASVAGGHPRSREPGL
jgi:hypothetical protein